MGSGKLRGSHEQREPAAGLEVGESDLKPDLVTKSSAGPQILSTYVA